MTKPEEHQGDDHKAQGKGSPILPTKPHSNDNRFGLIDSGKLNNIKADENWFIKKLKNMTSVIVFVAQTMGWGIKETLNFKKNWKVKNHDQQHGLDDGRSEMSHAMSGIIETVGTGNLLPAVGRIGALSFDLMHSVNLVRHSNGHDFMKDRKITFDLPDFVKEKIEGTVDVQSLKFQFTKNATNWQKVAEVFSDQYNRWLLVNSALNLKMFPNKAGRTAEVTTGLGFLVVGTWIANQNGVDTSTFDQIRGYMEATIGAGGLAAAVVDLFVNESDEESDVEIGDHDQFIQLPKQDNEKKLSSVLKIIPRFVARAHNDNKIFEIAAEIQSEGTPEQIKEFQDDVLLQEMFKNATERKKNSSSFLNATRSLIGSAVGDFKELSDHCVDVYAQMKKSEKGSKLSVIFQDMRSQPAKYGGAAQLATAQLYVPLALFTGIAGATNASSPVLSAFYLASGAAMASSWFFAHRGYAAKTKMSLRGIEVSGSSPANPKL